MDQWGGATIYIYMHTYIYIYTYIHMYKDTHAAG